MLLFRSEEHVERWLNERDRPRGAMMTAEQQWRLARDWYGNRLQPDWGRRPPDEAQRIFEKHGLTGPFWSLTK